MIKWNYPAAARRSCPGRDRVVRRRLRRRHPLAVAGARVSVAHDACRSWPIKDRARDVSRRPFSARCSPAPTAPVRHRSDCADRPGGGRGGAQSGRLSALPVDPGGRARVCARGARGRVQAGAARRAGRPQGVAGLRVPDGRPDPVRLAVRRDRRAGRDRDRRVRRARALAARLVQRERVCALGVRVGPAGVPARLERRRDRPRRRGQADGARLRRRRRLRRSRTSRWSRSPSPSRTGSRCARRRAATCATPAPPSRSWRSSRRSRCRCGRSTRRSSSCSPGPCSPSPSTCARPTAPCSPCATPRRTRSPASATTARSSSSCAACSPTPPRSRS